MSLCQRINENVYFVRIPYKDIFTTVYFIRTEVGVLLFDAASFDSDVDDYILPAIDELGIAADELKYVFISHPHIDHAGGLKRLLYYLPTITVVSAAQKHLEEYSDYNVISPGDGDLLLDVLKVVEIPGHTIRAGGILDTRDRTLISGDSLQLYGIFGSGRWGANIRFPAEHFSAIEKLKGMEIDNICAAHDYHPLGQFCVGRDKVRAALDACIEPLIRVRGLIEANPDKDDELIAAVYNDGTVPTLGAHVVTAVRGTMNE
jgi:glyoxylase-like metal-dependent hydrolase (beta-lactamase superfamily II)